MDVTQVRDRIAETLDESGDFENVAPIEGENDVIGIEANGALFFVKIIPADE